MTTHMTKIVNLTPHPLVFADGTTIESSGIARCEQTDREIGSVNGIPIVASEFGAVIGLPDEQLADCPCGQNNIFGGRICHQCGGSAGFAVMYVVSSITAQACRGREDVLVPARPIRDDKGRIIGCAALGRVYVA